MNIAFVIGCARSGTSILGELIAAHPAVKYVFEPHQVWDLAGPGVHGSDRLTAAHATPEVRQRIREWFEAHRGAATLIVDKTPRNALRIPFLRAVFPEAKFIHIVRDGRDVACSMMPGIGGSTWEHLKPPAWQELLTQQPPILRCALAWKETVEIALADLAEIPHLQVQYESLVQQTDVVARNVLRFLGLPEHSAVREFCGRIQNAVPGSYQAAHQSRWQRADHLSRVGRWRQNIPAAEQTLVATALAPLLRRLGYTASEIPFTPPICITGMHRSGTSMLAQLLHLCGIYLGPEKELSLSIASNPDGHWEHPGVLALNDEILNEFGGGWDWSPVWPKDWAISTPVQELQPKVWAILEEFRGQSCWGWKDPRMCLTLPFWKTLFPDMKIVVGLRNPLEVARSLQTRGLSSYAFGLALWKTYHEQLLNATRPDERIVTHFESYLPDPTAELRRVLSFLGVPATESSLDGCRTATKADLRHHGFTTQDLLDAEVDPAILELYQRLCREAGVPVDSPAPTTAASHSHKLRLDRVLARREDEKKRDYRRLIEQIRVIASAKLPATATVSVVSKGDDQLLQLGDRCCRHFPCADDGGYLWRHPADSADAIARLEAIRKQGVQFLLLPATAFWWMEFYGEFCTHLRGSYREIVTEPSCRIFALREADEVKRAV